MKKCSTRHYGEHNCDQVYRLCNGRCLSRPDPSELSPEAEQLAAIRSAVRTYLTVDGEPPCDWGKGARMRLARLVTS